MKQDSVLTVLAISDVHYFGLSRPQSRQAGICGELGADLELTETFLSIGIDELSVSPRAVLPLRQKIRETDVSKVREKLLADLLSDENTI